MSVERLGFGVQRRGFTTTALGLLIVSGCLLSACADSPTSPDPRVLESSYNTYSSGRVRDGNIPGLSNGIEGAIRLP